MKIKQLSIFLQNRMGSLSKPLEVLTVADVNIRAMCMADTSEFGILRLVVDDPAKGKEVLEQNNFLVKITDIIGIVMDDTPGGLTRILKIMKDNSIDLEYLYAFGNYEQDKAVLLLHADELDRLIEILVENDIIIVPVKYVHK